MQELKSAFEKCDRDGSNCIDASELKDVLISLGKNPTDEEVESMIASVDDNGNEPFMSLFELITVDVLHLKYAI
jgi:Ca2+-binding EF-hand superfamily protein